MRYIPIHQFHPDSAWYQDAGNAANAVRNAQPEERSTVISHHDAVWKALKEPLRTLSNGKCWYCESIDPRSDNAVDHYRPKGNVKGVTPPHTGYWWLAFDWKNYRFSCTYCNSIRSSATTVGGKQDHFPIWEESKRARSEDDDIDDELPLLLDPTKIADVRLISFSEDGNVGPAVDKSSEREYEMATESILKYHLKHPILVERRALRLSIIRNWIEEADKHIARYSKYKDSHEPDTIAKAAIARATAESFLRQIRDAVSASAEYSTAVKHLLAGMAAKSDASRSVLATL